MAECVQLRCVKINPLTWNKHMYWKSADKWPGELYECLVAYRCLDAEDNWIYERAMPDPKKHVWHSMEHNEIIVGPVEFWLNIEEPFE